MMAADDGSPGGVLCSWRGRGSLLLDVGTQFEHILLASHLELVGEAEVLHLDLRGNFGGGG